MERNEQMAFGGLMKFSQQMIHQASIAVDAFFQPFHGEKSQPYLLQGAEDIPMGAILFTKVERTAATVQARKKRRLMEHTRVMSASTRRQPKVFCNVKYVQDYKEIVFAGIADGPDITIRNDDWRYRTGASVIPVISGTRTVMNTGPEDIYEGEWVYYETPELSRKPDDKKVGNFTSPHDAFADHKNYHCHRAVLRPVTAENFAVDPDCIYRTIGKCVAFSRSGQMLDLSISSAVAPVPFGANTILTPTRVVVSASGPVPSGSAAVASGSGASGSGAPVMAQVSTGNIQRMNIGTDVIGFTLMSDGKDYELYTEDGSKPLTGADVVGLVSTPVTAETKVFESSANINGTVRKVTITFDGTNLRIYVEGNSKPFTSGGHSHHYSGRHPRAYPTGPAPAKRTLSGLRSSSGSHGGGLTRPPAALGSNGGLTGTLSNVVTQRRNDLGPMEADEEDEDEEEEDEESEDGTETVTSSSSSTAQ